MASAPPPATNAAAARPAIPAAAKWLTGAGMLPFAGLALAVLLAPPALAQVAAFSLLIYGAVILSFIGGIRWGLAIAPGSPLLEQGLWRALSISVIPSLAAWLAMLLPPALAPVVLAASLGIMLLSDWRAATRGEAPPWYPRLRWPPTLVAILSLLVVAAG